MSKKLKKPTKEELIRFNELYNEAKAINSELRKLDAKFKAFFKQERKAISYRGASVNFEVSQRNSFSKAAMVEKYGQDAYEDCKREGESLTPVFTLGSAAKKAS